MHDFIEFDANAILKPIPANKNPLSHLNVPAFTTEKNGVTYTVYEPVAYAKKVTIPSIKDKSIFTNMVKEMTKEINPEIQSLKDFTSLLENEIHALITKKDNAILLAKNASGQIRDAANKLNDGLKKIENFANFEKLERMTILLERSADALERLQKLQETGKLDKIISAIK